MGFTYHVDNLYNLTFGLASGAMLIDDIAWYFRQAAQDGVLGYRHLIDAREASFRITSGEMRWLTLHIRRVALPNPIGPVALVVAGDAGFGAARVLSVMAQDACTIEVFRDVDKAGLWIEAHNSLVA